MNKTKVDLSPHLAKILFAVIRRHLFIAGMNTKQFYIEARKGSLVAVFMLIESASEWCFDPETRAFYIGQNTEIALNKAQLPRAIAECERLGYDATLFKNALDLISQGPR